MRMSEEEYQQILTRMGKSRAVRPPSAPPTPTAQKKVTKAPKYHNQKVYIYEDGFISENKTSEHGKLKERFDSVKEYSRCAQLRLLEKAGVIQELKTQHTVLIQPAFTDAAGKRNQAITYRADFAYMENGKQVIEDVKAFDTRKKKYLLTEVFKLKWKLMKAKYPDFVFRLY